MINEQHVKRSHFGYIGHPVYSCCGKEIHGTKDMDTHFRTKHEADTPLIMQQLWLGHQYKALPYCFKLIKFCRAAPEG